MGVNTSSQKRPFIPVIDSDVNKNKLNRHKTSITEGTIQNFTNIDIGKLHKRQICLLPTKLYSDHKKRSDRVAKIRKKRTQQKRKKHSKTESLTNRQKLAQSLELPFPRDDVVGYDDVIVVCDGYFIHCLNDRRHFKTHFVTEGAGYDDVIVVCDDYFIHCLNDRRHFKTHFVTEGAEKPIRDKTIHERNELAATITKMSNGISFKNTEKLFDRWVRYGFSLCCRFLFKCKEAMVLNPHLATTLKKSIRLSIKASDHNEKAKHVDTAKAIGWQITRMFYRKQKEQNRIQNIYPAFKCICKSKPSADFFCSELLYIVVEVSRCIPSLEIDCDGVKIHQQYTQYTFIEGQLINRQQQKSLRAQICSVSLLHGVSSKFANQCFNSHSNLISIVPSFVRSKNFQTDRHQLKIEKCQTFTCKVKGFIPLGDQHFPHSIKAVDGSIVQTDIIEGNVNFTNLMVGDHIQSTTMSGTLGGVLMYYNRDCFITCAHVMLDEQSMISRKRNPIHKKDLRVFVKDKNGQTIECGNALRCDFETGSDTKPGIDVAVIEINSQWKVNPNSMVQDRAKNPHSHLYLGMSNEYLNDNCIDYELLTLTHSEVETMAFGQVTTVENCKIEFQPEQIIEIELKSLGHAVAVANGNTTFPVMIAQPAHFQMSQGTFPASKTFRIYNQLSLNVPLVPGDSGTCIYIRNCPFSRANAKCPLSDKNGKCPHSGCLGMAIAFSNGLSIVTPLKKIFEYIL